MLGKIFKINKRYLSTKINHIDTKSIFEFDDATSRRIKQINNKHSSLEILVEDLNSNKKLLNFNPHWLRFNCHSNESKQQDSGQLTINADKIPLSLLIAQIKIIDNLIQISWNKDSMQNDTIIPLNFLINNCPSETKQTSKYKHLKALNSLDYSTFFDTNGKKSDYGLYKWLKQLGEYGVCIVKGVECKEGAVRQIAELIAPVQKTIYGEIFDVKVDKNPINIAYSDVSLGFHMDLMYYESPPGLQFLHCLQFDSITEGGESIFLDSFEVAEDFRKQYPVLFQHLTRIPATFQKLHFSRTRPVSMIYQRPHIVLNSQNKIIAVNWSPPFEGPLKNVNEDDCKAYYESYLTFSKFLNNHPSIIEYRLKPGEVACFNNRRVLHGRQGFKSNNGIRHFQGCYLNIDEFKSELLVKEYMTSDKLKKENINYYENLINASYLELNAVNVGNHDYNS